MSPLAPLHQVNSIYSTPPPLTVMGRELTHGQGDEMYHSHVEVLAGVSRWNELPPWTTGMPPK